MGAGEFLWIAIFAGSVAMALTSKQALAPWLLLVGLAVFAYLAATLAFDLAFPYRTHNVSIYLVFFTPCVLTLSGMAGSAVRVLRFSRKRYVAHRDDRKSA